MISELNRLLEEFGETLKATSRAIQQKADVYIDEHEVGLETENDNVTTAEDDEIF